MSTSLVLFVDIIIRANSTAHIAMRARHYAAVNRRKETDQAAQHYIGRTLR